MSRALLLCAALVSCVSLPEGLPLTTKTGETVSVWLDPNFSPGETWGILAAFEDWNVALNGLVRFAPGAVPEGSLTVTRESATDPTNHGQPARYLAWTNRVGGQEVHVEPDRVAWAGYAVKSIVEHEVGHTLGLVDVLDNPATLMATDATFRMCIDETTIADLARVRGWEKERLREVCP